MNITKEALAGIPVEFLDTKKSVGYFWPEEHSVVFAYGQSLVKLLVKELTPQCVQNRAINYFLNGH